MFFCWDLNSKNLGSRSIFKDIPGPMMKFKDFQGLEKNYLIIQDLQGPYESWVKQTVPLLLTCFVHAERPCNKNHSWRRRTPLRHDIGQREIYTAKQQSPKAAGERGFLQLKYHDYPGPATEIVGPGTPKVPGPFPPFSPGPFCPDCLLPNPLSPSSNLLEVIVIHSNKQRLTDITRSEWFIRPVVLPWVVAKILSL